MARTNNLTNFLTDVADAIKEKLEDDTAIPASDFDTEILNLPSQGEYQTKSITITTNGETIVTPDQNYDAIEELTITTNVSGTDPSDATATSDDILYPKVAYTSTGRTVGNIQTVTEPLTTTSLDTLSNDFTKWMGDTTGVTQGFRTCVLDISEKYGICLIFYKDTTTLSIYEYDTENYAPTNKILDIPKSIYDSAPFKMAKMSKQLNEEGCLNIFIVADQWDTYRTTAVVQFDIVNKVLTKNAKAHSSLASNDWCVAANPLYPNVCAMSAVSTVANRNHGINCWVMVYNPTTNEFTNTIYLTDCRGNTAAWWAWVEWDNTGKVIKFQNAFGGGARYIRIIQITNDAFTTYRSVVNSGYQGSYVYTLWNDQYYFRNNSLIDISNNSVVKTFSEYTLTFNNGMAWTNTNELFVCNNSNSSYTYTCYEIDTENLTLTQKFQITVGDPIYFISDPEARLVYASFNDSSVTSSYRSKSVTRDLYKQVTIKEDTLYNTDDADVVAANILVNKIGYTDTGKIIGTMPNNGELIYTPSTVQQTIPAGYTSGGIVEASSGEGTILDVGESSASVNNTTLIFE